LVLALAIVSGGTAEAAILSSGFETDPVGSMPPGWTAGSYDGNPVTAHVTDTAAGSGVRSFYMDDWAGGSQLGVRTSFPTQSAGLLRQTGKARVEQTDVAIAPFTLLGSGNARCNNLLFGADGAFEYEDGHGNFVSTGVPYQAGEWYSFDYLINIDSRRWSFSIEDSSNNPIASASDLEFGTSLYFSYYELRSWGVGGSGTGQWYIDDLGLYLVPEPAGLGLVGLALLARRGRKLRRRRS